MLPRWCLNQGEQSWCISVLSVAPEEGDMGGGRRLASASVLVGAGSMLRPMLRTQEAYVAVWHVIAFWDDHMVCLSIVIVPVPCNCAGPDSEDLGASKSLDCP